MAIVKLKLREDSKKGFQVTLKETNRDDDIEGHLLPLPQEIDPTQETSAFCRWQLGYREEKAVRSSHTRITPIGIKHSSPEEYAKHAEDVKTYLNQWLNSGDNEWLRIRDALVAICSQLNTAGDEIDILLDVKNIDLCRLPLQEWNFFENHCPQAEIAFRLAKSKDAKPSIHPLSSSKIRILVVVGWNNDIDTAEDLQQIQRLEKLGAEVKYLEQPKREVLSDALWDQQAYHIFVYIGHSISKEDGQIGWIKINEEEHLSIEDVKNALQEAINKGLQLTIFNSCDGLGLANQLAQLHLPQSIVMREPVPNKVAVKFLKYFFEEFTRGQSLFAAVHRSRKRLEDVFKSCYPGVHWLPVICVSHSVKKPLTWQDLIESCSANDVSEPPPKESPTTPKSKKKFIAACLVLALISCGGVVAICLGSHQKPTEIIVGASQKNFTDVSGIPEGEWLFNGSTSWGEIIKKVHPKIQQELSQIKLILRRSTSGRGSKIGINMLKNGEISFALSSRHLNQDEQQDVLGKKLQQHGVADDVIAIVVNRNLGISNLTVEQLKGIYTGNFTNWSQVGGPNIPITPYSRPPEESGTTEFFKEKVLQHQNFGTNVKFQPTTTDIQQKIGNSDSGGIYYLTSSEISKSLVKPLRINSIEPKPTEEYPLVRRLFVITKQDGGRDEEIGNAYVKLLLTKQGQELIKEALQEQK